MLVFGTGLMAAGLAVGLAALVVIHLLPTGLSPLRNAVSQYGITPYRSGYRVQTLGYAVAGIGAAAAVAALPGPTSVVVVLCVLFAVARGLISWFPMDAPGEARSDHGRRHAVLAFVAFGAVALGARRFASLLHADGVDPGLQTMCNVLAVLMLVSFLGMSANRQTRGNYFGLMERFFYACMTAWLVCVAVAAASR